MRSTARIMWHVDVMNNVVCIALVNMTNNTQPMALIATSIVVFAWYCNVVHVRYVAIKTAVHVLCIQFPCWVVLMSWH
jgi:hypothetical protein